MQYTGESERTVQQRVAALFCRKLNYENLGNLLNAENSNIMPDKLLKYLSGRGYSRQLCGEAIDKLKKAASNQCDDLYESNKAVYTLLRYGVKIKDESENQFKTVKFIDFDCISNNDFYIAQEVTVKGSNTKRPDFVVYVNGIALAVIELKNSRVSVAKGIRQNITNQRGIFIRDFFTTIQFCAAGNESEGMRYGTVLTPEKYYLEWKADNFQQNEEERDETDVLIDEKCADVEGKLYKQLFMLFYKKRFLDIIRNFIIFDGRTKKICRYNQYYAVKRAVNRINNRKDGIIWHTQGSGKSMTMLLLSKKILAENPNARILIITDRHELDAQIEKLYSSVNENIVRAGSGNELINILNSYDSRIICSLIHKFGRRDIETKDVDYDEYIKNIKSAVPKSFSPKGDLVVFVDECHRSQSGRLHQAMRMILPDSVFIGFTGTPLLKDDKKSVDVFGGYIHSYKFNEAVLDNVVLDLRYEAREIPQNISSEEKIDQWFNVKTMGLSSRAKAKLKSRWANMNKVFSSASRLEKIANDIIFDFNVKTRLASGRGNAILVANDILTACRYYEIFQSKGFKQCAVISSYEPSVYSLRTDAVSDTEDTELFKKYEVYQKMLNGKSVKNFERDVIKQFVNEPEKMKLLIVVDKLLTGFDAPKCTYLYIDRQMRDHTLFQAICRVNRLDDADKEFGYIVDYKHLFSNLADAVGKYTSSAFDKYESKEIEGLLKDRALEAKSCFFDILDCADELCEGVQEPWSEREYIKYFCGDDEDNESELYAKRIELLYHLLHKLMRAFEEFSEHMYSLGYSDYDRDKYNKKVISYVSLQSLINKWSGDFIDLSQYQPGMRDLIDNCLDADSAQLLGGFNDYTVLDLIKSKKDIFRNGSKKSKDGAAEVIERNLNANISDNMEINPAFYEKMSAILNDLIKKRRQSVIEYKELLDEYRKLAEILYNHENDKHYPDSVKSNSLKRAIYDNFGENEAKTNELFDAFISARQTGFRENRPKEMKIKQALFNVLKDHSEIERLYGIIVKNKEY